MHSFRCYGAFSFSCVAVKCIPAKKQLYCARTKHLEWLREGSEEGNEGAQRDARGGDTILFRSEVKIFSKWVLISNLQDTKDEKFSY